MGYGAQGKEPLFVISDFGFLISDLFIKELRRCGILIEIETVPTRDRRLKN
jgi:hypothetical protein